MSQYPKDSFDDVEAYAPGEAGKHRAMSARGAGARRRGGLKWIGLLAVFALLVGAFGYFVYPRLMDEDTAPASGEESAQEGEENGSAGSGEDAESEASGENGSSEEDPEDPESNGSEGDDEDSEEPSPASDTTTPVQVASYQGPEGSATDMGGELQGLDYNVVWEGPWGFGDLASTPIVLYPAGASDAEQAIAQELAENLDVGAVEEHPQVTYVTYVVGPDGSE
jgi:hypothetical protein